MKQMVTDYVALEERGWKIAFFLLPLAGLALLVLGWRRAQASAAHEGWPAVSAVITDSRVEEVQDGGKTVYVPRLSYRYFLDDKKYEGTRLAFDEGSYRFDSKARAEEITLANPVSREVRVRVNPSDPAVSHLFEQPDHSGGMMMGFGAALMVIFIITEIYFHTSHDEPDIDLHIGDIPAAPAAKG